MQTRASRSGRPGGRHAARTALSLGGRAWDACTVPLEVCLGPMAAMLARGVEELVGELLGATPRRCASWSRLAWDLSASPAALVLVGIDEEFDRDRAHALSVDCPDACVIACGLHAAELTVMRAGEVLLAGALTAESLRDAIAAAA